MGIIYYRVKHDDSFDVGLTIEMAKNTFIKFNVIVLPFMITLTICRFMPFYIQIAISLMVVVGIQIVSFFLHKLVYKIKDLYKVNIVGYKTYLTIWFVVFVVITFVVLYGFPTYQVEKALNLQNHTPIYGIYDGYDTDLDSSYVLELVDEYEEDQYDYPNPPVAEDLPDKFYKDSPITQIYYDLRNDVTYETYHVDLYRTYILKIDSSNNVKVFEYKDIRNLIVVDDVFYLIEQDSNLIEITDENLNVTAIFKIPLHDELFHKQMISSELFYSIDSGKLLFTTIETSRVSNEEVYHYKEYNVIQDNIDLTLPFYSHFGLFHIILLFMVMFVPTSNFKAHITRIDFESQISKNKSKEE
jgi:hypothetical protein